jgi:hypothetical protein
MTRGLGGVLTFPSRGITSGAATATIFYRFISNLNKPPIIISSQEIPHIIKKSLSTFETYWESPDFEHFDGQAPSREKLSNALQEARGNVNGAAPSFYFDIKPHSHQQTIL